MRLKRTLAAVASVALLVGGAEGASADQIVNDVDLTLDPTLETLSLTTGGSAGTVTFRVEPTNDTENGCNFQGTREAMVANVTTSNGAVATVSPSTVTFDSCGDTPSVTVTPVGAGPATITLTQASNNTGGTFDFAPANFEVVVATPAPTDSTAPTVTASATTTSGAYTFGTWSDGDVTVILNGSDNAGGSGLKHIRYTTDGSTPTATTGTVYTAPFLVTAEGTTIVKVFLHISREEQAERLQARLDEPDKNWKFSTADLAERAHWDRYQEVYREAIAATSTEEAPWYVVPADRKWYRNLAVASILVDRLERLDMAYPPAEEGLADVVID